MLVKVSWDDGVTWEPPCCLSECYPDDPGGYEDALDSLLTVGRHWEGGGAAAFCLIMRVK